jgi:hypothetical protein
MRNRLEYDSMPFDGEIVDRQKGHIPQNSLATKQDAAEDEALSLSVDQMQRILAMLFTTTMAHRLFQEERFGL